MTPIIQPITDPSSQKQKQGKSSESINIILLTSHLNGLDTFGAKRVLEIGGRDEDYNRLSDFFFRTGAQYETVSLDSDLSDQPYRCRINFMYLPCEEQYDLIISIGVFEGYGIDSNFRGYGHLDPFTNSSRLEQLANLTQPGGFHIIGTIGGPCIFTNKELAKNKRFEVLHRIKPFYNRNERGDAEEIYASSELVVLRKTA